MSEVTRISKIILQVICQLFWLSALMVGLGGIYLMLNYRQTGLLFQNIAIILPAILALVSAAVLLSAGMIGCWVSIRDSAGLQALFVYLLLIVFCLQATAATLSYVNIGKGCQVKLEDAWIFVLHLIIFSSGAIAAVLIVGLISVAKLMRDEPLQEYQVLDRDMIS
ncbi:hypothetical protein Z043_113981 [Scleropages formosus]|uniref:Tetraspanin-3-like n=1 Tax=Scleropages formosus TaxID=113540 RepID=A0A0P7WU35_SCLFO|nr:hypothetical protein Z043_113981 [Scleropages formosus]